MELLKSLRKIKKIKNFLLNASVHSALKMNLPDTVSLKLLSISKPSIILPVPLDSINHFIPNQTLKRIFYPVEVSKPNVPGFIWDGDWDLQALKIDDHYQEYSLSYRSVFQIFKEGRHFKNCDEYKMKADLIQRNVNTARGNTLSDLDRYFEGLLSLKEMIEKKGYKSQNELNIKKKDDEIGVFVDRYGHLLKAEDNFSGTHRFGLAKVLKLPEVYVNIIAVHRKWAKDHMWQLVTDRSFLVEYLRSKN